MHRRTQVLTSFATTGAMLVMSLGTSVLLARGLGPDGRGLLLALTFWPALLAALLNFSLNEAVAYHVAWRVDTPDEPRTIAASFQLVLAVALAASLVALIAIFVILPPKYRDHLDLVMLYAVAFVLISQLEQFSRAVLQGRGAILTLNAARLVQPSFYLVLLSSFMAAGFLEVSTAMTAALGALLVSLAVGMTLVRPASFRFQAGPHRRIAATGWAFHKANILLYAASEFDKAIVLVFLTTTQAGLYAVALAISGIGSGVVLQSLGLMLMRDMAAANEMEGRRSVFVRSTRAAFAILVLGNGFAAILTPWLVPLLFGAKFAAAIPVTVLLLGMGVCNGGRKMIDRALRATHHTRIGMLGEATALVGVVVFGAIGALAGGLEGLALGMVVAQTIALVLVTQLARRHFEASLFELWPFQKAVLKDVRAFFGKARSPAVAA